jgi:hypothetical protein
MQSKADPEARMGRDQTRRLLDNLNTFVSFRLTDMVTAEEVTKGLTCTVQLPDTSIGHSYGGVGGLSGHAQQRQARREVPLIRPAWLTGLPRGDAFCRIAGGWWKLRVPLLDPISQETLERLGLAAMWRAMDPNTVHEGVLCDDRVPLPASAQLAEHWPLPPSRQLSAGGAMRLASKSLKPPSRSFSQGIRRALRFFRRWGRRRVQP